MTCQDISTRDECNASPTCVWNVRDQKCEPLIERDDPLHLAMAIGMGFACAGIIYPMGVVIRYKSFAKKPLGPFDIVITALFQVPVLICMAVSLSYPYRSELFKSLAGTTLGSAGVLTLGVIAIWLWNLWKAYEEYDYATGIRVAIGLAAMIIAVFAIASYFKRGPNPDDPTQDPE